MLQFFTIIFSIVFYFFFQASESSGLAATQSRAMPHFEAAVWHSPVHNNQDVFEVRLPALSSLVLFLLMIYHLSSSFLLPCLLCQFWSPAILWKLYGYIIIHIWCFFTQIFSHISTFMLQFMDKPILRQKKAAHGISSACGSLLIVPSHCLIF